MSKECIDLDEKDLNHEFQSKVCNPAYSDLTHPLYSSSIIGAGGNIYVVGGALKSGFTAYTSQVWRVVF